MTCDCSIKPISSAIAIGTGGPFGAEGPIIMTGAAFGSLFAQAFHLSANERKTLLVAGATAGMTAIFATPLAAVLLAVELLLFEWQPRSFIPVASAAAVAAGLRVPLMGGTMRSPLTAVVFLLELTHDTNLLTPLLIACVAAHAVTVLMMRRSILTEKVARRGHHVSREYSVNPLARFHVDEVMRPPVEDDEIHPAALAVTHPDELLEEAMDKMILGGVDGLPVVSRESPSRIVGYLDHTAMSAAWRELRDEEHVREDGGLRAQLRLLRRRVRKLSVR